MEPITSYSFAKEYGAIFRHIDPTLDWSIEWSQDPEDYDAYDWKDSRPKPTKAECDALWPQLHLQMGLAAAEGNRQVAYMNESDPLFFKWQRGEATEQEWRDKVAEIKARFPDPTE